MTWAIENPEPYYDFMRKFFPVQTNVVSDFTTCMTDEDPEDPEHDRAGGPEPKGTSKGTGKEKGKEKGKDDKPPPPKGELNAFQRISSLLKNPEKKGMPAIAKVPINIVR